MNIKDIITESQQKCPHCGGPVVEYSELVEGKKDACYYKVKASAKVWPSAYASGRLVQCRKKGSANYGNKSEGLAEGLNEFAPPDDDDDYDDEEDDFPEMFEAPFTAVINGKKQTGTVIIYPGEVTSAEWHLKDTIYIKTGMDNVHNTSDFITHAAEYIQEIIKLNGRGHNYVKHLKRRGQGMAENFADGRNPQDKGDAKRHGINTKASVSSLRKTAKQGGRKGQLAHWMANMKSGRAKNEGVTKDGDPQLLFYAKLPEGTKVYARVKDAEQLADLQQQYRGAEIKTFDFRRPDVQKWLEARRINLRKFTLGMVQTMYDVMEAAHTTNFNDDDWYEINPDTKSIVSQQGPQAYQVPFGQRQITLPNGNIVVRGMRAKYMGLDTGLDDPQQNEDGTWGAL